MSIKNYGVVSAGHEKTAEAGKEMLKLGGNAFDAIAAAILASTVTEPCLTSLGGGGFLLARSANNKNILFDFFSQTPHAKKHEVDFYPITVDFGDAKQEFHIGLGSIAVPGNVSGIFYTHKKLGRLPMAEVAAPAIYYAKNGIKLNKFQAYCLFLLKPIMTNTPESRQIFAPHEKLLCEGDTIFMQELANTLEHLAKEGPREFYEGEISKKIISDCEKYGGYLTAKDLKNYKVIERKPLKINYRGNEFITNPPPSSGGTLIAFSLKLLEKYDLQKIGFGTKKYIELLSKVMSETNNARNDGYDAHIYRENIAEEFLSENHIKKFANKLGGTTHISVIDSEGNAASATTSNGEGSSYIVPGTGIMLNNMLGEEDLSPNGFHSWPENRRISSMMSPTIVLKNKKPEIALGSGGSTRIRTAILQVISNIIDFKMSIKKAVEAPRIHLEQKNLNIEPGFEKKEINEVKLPKTKVILWEEKSMFFGGVHTAFENKKGQISGAGDKRRSGASIAV